MYVTEYLVTQQRVADAHPERVLSINAEDLDNDSARLVQFLGSSAE